MTTRPGAAFEPRYTVTARDARGKLALAFLHQTRREADFLVERLKARADVTKVTKRKEA